MSADEVVDQRGGRLSPQTFELPLSEIRIGYRSALYFNRTRAIMAKNKPDQVVTMQVFQKNYAMLCGMDEAIAVLKTCAGEFSTPEVAEAVFERYLYAKHQARTYRSGMDLAIWQGEYRDFMRKLVEHERALEDNWKGGWDQLQVQALYDGELIAPWEPVLTITGPYRLFAHLESVYLGILARQTKIATNVQRVVAACNGKPLLFFADRFDHYATQGGDGYAAHVAGAQAVATAAMGRWWGDPGMGTMPHALIAAYGGDLLSATAAFAEHYPDANLIALVDFSNDCVDESVKCAKRFGTKLWGVRLDTSENMVDDSISQDDMGDFRPTGVNHVLVGKVRGALDSHGFQHVKIIVSGGFTAEKIADFETRGVPVDAYAVGSSLLQGSNDFTADIVAPVAKVGRHQRDASRLEEVG